MPIQNITRMFVVYPLSHVEKFNLYLKLILSIVVWSFTLLLHIKEVLDSYLCQGASCPDNFFKTFLSYSGKMVGEHIK